MREIQGNARTVRELLKGQKYAIDYYQREYKWETRQIQELIDDLTGRFLEDYRPGDPRKAVAGYGHYFLGSIVVSRKDGRNYMVDGQQRLTSLTLLMMYLRNLQRERATKVNIDELIYSESYGEKSFNLQDDERTSTMDALFEERTPLEVSGQAESVSNLIGRYRDITDYFPAEVAGDALPYFIDWLIENVHLVEITAYSDDDAYTIFETMNDRGLSLTPTELLKGFLLTKIADENQRNAANDFWKQRTQQLRDVDRETEPDFFKAWLRSKYAETDRAPRKGAKPDFDRIGAEFHRWVREHATDRDNDPLTLRTSDQFLSFIHRDFDFYSRQYLRLMDAARKLIPGLEFVFYNARTGFTPQYMLLLAPMQPDDTDEVAQKKARPVAMFVDTLLAWRIWNYRSITYNNMQSAMFRVVRDIRGLAPEPLATRLLATLANETETFATNDRLSLHQGNGWQLHLLLARMTDYVEQQSGMPSHFLEYVGGSGNARYEVEHIWAFKPERHTDEFDHDADFAEHRNRLGGLLLLPKGFNASYGAMPYPEKVEKYNEAQNLLARSLHPNCYDHNPGFSQFIARSGLRFRSHPEFKKADLEARQELYRAIAERIWNPDHLLKEVEA